MVTRILLFCAALAVCSEGFPQRPTPNVITGGNSRKKDVPWPSIGEYRKKPQPPRATYRQPTGSTFYERAYARVLINYIRHVPSCAAHRKQHYTLNTRK